MPLAKGDLAPPFSLEDHEGKRVSLADLKGQRVVLWFYPKADTPGCTREGCGFRDLQAEFAAKGATILGVSYDPPAENAAFAKKYRFAYRLLSDVDRATAKAYGAFNPAEAEYPHRNTYVIGPEGTIEQALVEVNAKTHPRSLLDAL